ncbi:hypothetical protein J7E52_09490 [Bacillus sp. ISL-34]|uniref:hypothetical protein n=1 Tax=Bacillus sp. ISL-34 TaxID=2819121 RepID=UPI001BE64156|nr:hypothetical protein [Bacillus sp. ISL-34]MBT2646949.1 hypothetical protein [Bacillus sp. ISL-34]
MADILAFLFFFGAGALLVTAIVFLVERKFKKALIMLGLMLVSLILFIIAVMFTDIGTEATTEEVEEDVITVYGTVQVIFQLIGRRGKLLSLNCLLDKANFNFSSNVISTDISYCLKKALG